MAQKFDNLEDAGLALKVLTYLTREPISMTVESPDDGGWYDGGWLVHSDIELIVALQIVVPSGYGSKESWYASACAKREEWRLTAKGTPEYTRVAAKAEDLPYRPMPAYVTRARKQASDDLRRRNAEMDPSYRLEETLATNPFLPIDIQNQMDAGYRWDGHGWVFIDDE